MWWNFPFIVSLYVSALSLSLVKMHTIFQRTPYCSDIALLVPSTVVWYGYRRMVECGGIISFYCFFVRFRF